MMRKYICNKVRQEGFYDVIVVGGGTAGVVAAISAGIEGLKTLVIEQYGSLGGSQTLGLVTPVMPGLVANDRGQCSIHQEIVRRMYLSGHSTTSTQNDGVWFDPTYLAFTLEQLIQEAGVEIMYHTALVDCDVTDCEIKSVIVHNKDGLSEIKARNFIDASGDADLAYLAGAGFSSGDDDGKNQSVTLRFEMANVDLDRVKSYLKECGQMFYDTTPGLGTDGKNATGFLTLLKTKRLEGELTEEDVAHFQFFSIPGKPGFVSFNCPELGSKKNVLDAKFISQKQIEGKIAMLRIARFCVKNIPGFENAVISHYSPVIGIRESRRIHAKYELTVDDVLNFRKFEDGICQSNYPLDVHGSRQRARAYAPLPAEEHYYEIPFRCMITHGLRNLVVAGRCIGADFYAQSTARVQHSCRATGEAAGIAAKISTDTGVCLNAVNGAQVRRVMELRGAVFHNNTLSLATQMDLEIKSS